MEIDKLESIEVDQKKRQPHQSPMPAINFTIVGEVKYQGATKLAQPNFGVLPPIQSGQENRYGSKSIGSRNPVDRDTKSWLYELDQ